MKHLCIMKLIIIALTFLISLGSFAQERFKPLDSKVSEDLFCICFAEDGFGYIGAANGKLLISKDNGRTWDNEVINWLAFDNPRNYSITDIQFISKDTGFLVLTSQSQLNNKLLYTTDKGESWRSKDDYNLAGSVIHKLLYIDANNAVLGGSGYFTGNNLVKISADTVEKEIFSHFNPEFGITDIASSGDSDHLLMAVASDGNVYYTTDSGLNWNTTKSNFNKNLFEGIAINSVIHHNESWIIAIDSSTSLFISNDTGATWVPRLTTFSYPIHTSLASKNKDTWFAVGYSPQFDSTGEITWFENNLARNQYVDMMLNDVALSAEGVAFVIGDSGAIFSDMGFLNSVNKKLNKSQGLNIYPNPSKSGMFKTDLSGEYQMSVIDCSGRVKINETVHSNMIDLNCLANGVYFILIQQNENYYQAKVEKIGG